MPSISGHHQVHEDHVGQELISLFHCLLSIDRLSYRLGHRVVQLQSQTVAFLVMLIDRRNHHLFQPLLYQVATGGLSSADISTPIRALLQGQKNARVILGDVEDVDVGGKTVALADGEQIGYDTLVLAPGAHHSYFGRDEWANDAPASAQRNIPR